MRWTGLRHYHDQNLQVLHMYDSYWQSRRSHVEGENGSNWGTTSDIMSGRETPPSRGCCIILPESRPPRKEKYHIMVCMVLIFGPHAPDVELMTQKSPKIETLKICEQTWPWTLNSTLIIIPPLLLPPPPASSICSLKNEFEFILAY